MNLIFRASYAQVFLLLMINGITVSGCNDAPDASDISSVNAISSATPIRGVGSGRCLDVYRADATPGTRLIIWDCFGAENQAFRFTADNELRTLGDTRCLQAASDQLGAPAVIAECNQQNAQKWQLNPNGTISSRESSLCLDVQPAATANESPVLLWTCHGDSNQRWIVQTSTDTTAPTPPVNVQATQIQCKTASIQWDAATDDVGVVAYDIYHDGQLMTSVDGTARSADLVVVPGVAWGIYVNARDAAGNVSQASNTVPVKPPQCQVDSEAPTAPTNLTGSPSGTAISLSWTASTDNVGVAGYDIYRDNEKVGSVAGSSLIFVDNGLAANTAYLYVVVARDAQANNSAASGSISVISGGNCNTAVCGVNEVARDNDLPWGLTQLPDSTVLYTRRDSHEIVRLNPLSGETRVVGAIPNVEGTDGEGGLLGMAVADNFANDPWLYIMHTSATDNRIIRVRYVNESVDVNSLQVLVAGILRNKYHNGGRLRVGPDGKLYAATGDAQNGDNSQNLGNLSGKILRMNLDGSVPSDNPFGTLIWSYGHRNPQGLAFDSQGRLWEQEFGNAVMDETNLIERGGNYGWPNCEGTSSQSGGGCGTAGFIAPKRTYTTAEGSCSGIAIVRDNLYVACLRGQRLYRHDISGSDLTNQQQFFTGTYGRLRTVEPTRDGNLWMTTTNSGDKDSIPRNSDEKIFQVLLGN